LAGQVLACARRGAGGGVTEHRPVVTEQKVRRCSCDIPRPWTDPRRSGFCVACLGKLPPPLPVEVERLFDVFAGVAEAAGIKKVAEVPEDYDPQFESFKAWTLARVRWGQGLYGEAWRSKHMPREAQEELLDCCVYAFAQMVKDGERDADLLDAATHVYRAFLAFRRYEAHQKGTP
jgi:hypothetical protein